jgi:hypothetical protein
VTAVFAVFSRLALMALLDNISDMESRPYWKIGDNILYKTGISTRKCILLRGHV